MARKGDITVGCKVNKSFADKIRNSAYERGVGVNGFVKNVLESYYEDDFGSGYTEEIISIASSIGVDAGSLLKNIAYLVEKGFIGVENGKMVHRAYPKDPEYISLDLAVDSMETTEAQKRKIKADIFTKLQQAGLNPVLDDVGNGAGV